MRFLNLAIHYPKPEHIQDLLKAMQNLALALENVPGLIEATAWQEQTGKRIIATSFWRSEEDFRRALPLIGNTIKDVPFSEWELRPREILKLDELASE